MVPHRTSARENSHPRGKRKLDFTRHDSHRPLRGKVFFLDLPQKSLEALERELTQQGGVVEKFFHRDVGYLITNQHKPNRKGVPLPLSPADTSSKSSNADSTKAKAPVAYRTRSGRSAQILAASLEKQRGKKPMDVIKLAREWNTKILTLEELTAELKKFKPPLPPQKKDKHSILVPKLRKLKPPFMKVEDLSGNFRPLIYETDTWPLPRFDCPPNASPYDTPKKSGKATQLSRATGARLTQDLAASFPGVATVTAKRRPGYCEPCAMRYEDLKLHLCSKKHCEYATNEANFATIDEFVLKNGLSFDLFTKKMNEQYSNESNCVSKPTDAAVLTPPNSPATTTNTKALVTPDKCTISAGFASPKLGALCLTPVKLTPVKTHGQSPRAMPTDDETINKLKRQLDNASILPCIKKLKEDFKLVKEENVPETPEKLHQQPVRPAGSPLYDIQSLMHRFSGAESEDKIAATSPRNKKIWSKFMSMTNFQDLLDEVTRDSPLNSSVTISPGTSPVVRKSPRLLKRHTSLVVDSGPVQNCPPPSLLTVSLPLQHVCLHQQSQSTLLHSLSSGYLMPSHLLGVPLEGPLLEKIVQSIVGGLHEEGEGEEEAVEE